MRGAKGPVVLLVLAGAIGPLSGCRTSAVATCEDTYDSLEALPCGPDYFALVDVLSCETKADECQEAGIAWHLWDEWERCIANRAICDDEGFMVIPIEECGPYPCAPEI